MALATASLFDVGPFVPLFFHVQLTKNVKAAYGFGCQKEMLFGYYLDPESMHCFHEFFNKLKFKEGLRKY